MFDWILVIILAYLFFSLASLGDKLVLNSNSNPKLYVFYVGLLNFLVVLLIPFFGIKLPGTESFFWIILTSSVIILGLYALYFAVSKFEITRIVPMVGASQPMFVLLLSWIFWEYSVIKYSDLWAFVFLLLGSIIISFEKKPQFTKSLLKISLLTSFLAALGFILTKMVFLNQDFINGIIWIGIFNFLFSLIFLYDNNVREEIFIKKSGSNKKVIFLIIFTQLSGGIAGILQNFAIYLAPTSGLPIINALRGVQYVFLFIITLIFSIFYPKILKEEISKKVIIQKFTAIILIITGLTILVL